MFCISKRKGKSRRNRCDGKKIDAKDELKSMELLLSKAQDREDDRERKRVGVKVSLSELAWKLTAFMDNPMLRLVGIFMKILAL